MDGAQKGQAWQSVDWPGATRPAGATRPGARRSFERLDSAAAEGAIIGGVAASVLGRPRLTEDIDVLMILERQEWAPFLEAGRDFGFVARIDDALDFAEKSRVLLVLHQPSGIPIDVVLGALPLEDEIVRGARHVELAGVRLPLATPESIVVMKAIARRAATSPTSRVFWRFTIDSILAGFVPG